ncbi:MAG: PQQ-binding-like beta-propeller repeat protein [Armatimonadetes bacterium]|nr:PQQ-binding-like beta-propeller repeat protein [Armatimonadota bacterium]
MKAVLFKRPGYPILFMLNRLKTIGCISCLIGVLTGSGALAQTPPDRWATFRHDYQRTGRTSIVGPQNFSIQEWRQAVASGVGPNYGVVTSSPSIGLDGSVYISGRAKDETGGISTYLVSFSPTGLLRWRREIGTGQTDSSPSLNSSDTVYIGTGFQTGGSWGIQSLTKDGEFLWWSFDIFDRVLASPTLSADEKTVYVGSQNGIFYALDASRLGVSAWSSDQLIGVINSSAALGSDGTLYFGSQGDGGRINAVRPNGSLLWSYNTEGLVEAAPALSRNGILYFGTTEGIVYALDTKTVTTATDPASAFLWKNEDYRGFSYHSSVALGSDDTLYLGNTEGQLIAFDPNTGRRKWSFDVRTDGGDETGAIYSSAAVGGDDTVYFGCDNGVLYALDPSQTDRAKLKAKINLGSPLESSPAIGPDGTLYIGSMDGFLYAFRRSLPGDLTGDGRITVADASLMLQLVVTGAATPEQINKADVAPKNADNTYGDRKLDIQDPVRVLRYMVGLEPVFP